MTTAELRAIRQALNESRMALLAAFLVVNDAVKQREARAKRQLVVRLRGLDEFRNSTAHEEHRG
jgi:hypothetical protein